MKFFNILVLSALIVLLFSNCKSDREPLKFEMEYFEESFTVNPGFDPLLTHVFEFPNMATLIEQYKSTHSFSDSDIVSILPGSFRILNVSGTEDYNFINEISVKIASFDNPDQKFEIFYHQPTFNRLGSNLTLIPNEKELREIMLQNRFTVEVHLIRFKDRPSTTITTRFEMTFDVR